MLATKLGKTPNLGRHLWLLIILTLSKATNILRKPQKNQVFVAFAFTKPRIALKTLVLSGHLWFSRFPTATQTTNAAQNP